MKEEQEKLTKLLNASGFAFQLALEAAVHAASTCEQWRVTAREHPWSTQTGRGFIDLVLSRDNLHLVIECKRSRDAVWMFLMPDQKQLQRSHARIRWTDVMPHRRNLSEWGDVQVYPQSPEADFCVVRGQGETDSPLLERLASSITDAAESLSGDLLELRKGSRAVNVILPVIVTTASLVLSRFDPKNVDLRSGELPTADFSTVPHVRFRKSLSMSSPPNEFDAELLRDLSVASERTVFIVEGVHFTEWLSELEIRDSSRPWESARTVAEAMGG